MNLVTKNPGYLELNFQLPAGAAAPHPPGGRPSRWWRWDPLRPGRMVNEWDLWLMKGWLRVSQGLVKGWLRVD